MRLACSSNKQLGPMVETVFHMIAGRENSGGEGYGVCALQYAILFVAL